MSFLDPELPEPRDVVRRQLLNGARIAFEQFRTSNRRLYGLVWHHPTLDAEEVLAELGTDARDYLLSAYATYDYLNTLKPNDPLELPALRAITIHDDGTATLAAESSSSSSSSSTSESAST